MTLCDCDASPLHLPSFPTRRSSDLERFESVGRRVQGAAAQRRSDHEEPGPASRRSTTAASGLPRPRRSEEHTSELQSHSDLVCRLPLEKKNDYAPAIEANINTMPLT